MKNIKSFQEYNQNQLNEGLLSKSLIAGLLMSIGSLSAQEKDKFIAQKNSEIQKIRAQEREDIKTVNNKWVAADKVYMKEKIDTWLANNPGKTEKDYWKEQERLAKQDDVPLDGLQGPDFKSTRCGISKAGAKDAKKEWSKK